MQPLVGDFPNSTPHRVAEFVSGLGSSTVDGVRVMVECCCSRVLFLHAVEMVFLWRVFRFWSGCSVVGVV
jgi:hypothetical protein